MSQITIPAQIPGVVYLKPSPEEDVFKKEGDEVAVGDTLALVEVMKSFLPVTAEAAGTFGKYLVDNEQAIDAGQPICEIKGRE